MRPRCAWHRPLPRPRPRRPRSGAMCSRRAPPPILCPLSTTCSSRGACASMARCCRCVPSHRCPHHYETKTEYMQYCLVPLRTSNFFWSNISWGISAILYVAFQNMNCIVSTLPRSLPLFLCLPPAIIRHPTTAAPRCPRCDAATVGRAPRARPDAAGGQRERRRGDRTAATVVRLRRV
jgi:hypothetical protein